MSKRTRNLILLGIVVLCLLASLPLFHREPSYQGRRLTSWLELFYVNTRSTFPGDSSGVAVVPQGISTEECRLAISAIGTNAIPTLVNLAQVKDSSLKLKVLKLASRQRFISFKRSRALYYHRLSMAGFQNLGPAAKAAVPALTELLNDPDYDVRCTAAWDLGQIGPAAHDAVPTLVKCLNDTNSDFRFQVFQSLAGIHDQPEVVIPILIAALRKPQTDKVIYEIALRGLGSFGPQASNTVPFVQLFLTNNVSFVAWAATNALKQIDPIAAAQAGVK